LCRDDGGASAQGNFREEVKVIVATKQRYRPCSQRGSEPHAFRGRRCRVLALAVLPSPLWVGSSCPLDEQNLNLSSVRIPSTSIEQSAAIDLPLERAVLTLPEVKTVYSKAGTASLAADPMPPNASDNYIILKPKNEWPEA
jgi:cobalt-zinc-cadmium resistance protein CzcA